MKTNKKHNKTLIVVSAVVLIGLGIFGYNMLSVETTKCYIDRNPNGYYTPRWSPGGIGFFTVGESVVSGGVRMICKEDPKNWYGKDSDGAYTYKCVYSPGLDEFGYVTNKWCYVNGKTRGDCDYLFTGNYICKQDENIIYFCGVDPLSGEFEAELNDPYSATTGAKFTEWIKSSYNCDDYPPIATTTTITQQTYCYDSDVSGSYPNGKDPNTKGIVSITQGMLQPQIYVDFCTGSQLNEYFCNGNQLGTDFFFCPYNCEYGKCTGGSGTTTTIPIGTTTVTPITTTTVTVTTTTTTPGMTTTISGTTTIQIYCKYLYWLDNEHKTTCNLNKFCGSYDEYYYPGLRTFNTLTECENALSTECDGLFMFGRCISLLILTLIFLSVSIIGGFVYYKKQK